MYEPKWSKAKKHLCSLICLSLQDRVDFHIINYRKAHDQLGRAVITVDKQEIVSMCTITSEMAIGEKEWELELKGAKGNTLHEEAHRLILEEGKFAQYDFFDALEEHFQTPIEESLLSSNMLRKILALMDRRVGKRRLVKMKEFMMSENEVIQYFYVLRCQADGIK